MTKENDIRGGESLKAPAAQLSPETREALDDALERGLQSGVSSESWDEVVAAAKLRHGIS